MFPLSPTVPGKREHIPPSRDPATNSRGCNEAEPLFQVSCLAEPSFAAHGLPYTPKSDFLAPWAPRGSWVLTQRLTEAIHLPLMKASVTRFISKKRT